MRFEAAEEGRGRFPLDATGVGAKLEDEGLVKDEGWKVFEDCAE